MAQIYNIYCDESCHLENDHQTAMVLGCVWCPLEKIKEISTRISEIKVQHDLKKDFEIKWIKVSDKKLDFYLNIIDYFFDNIDLHFRCLVVPDKKLLDHKRFNSTHDDFYYKLYFDLLKIIFNPKEKYKIYLDIKDTRGASKVAKLYDVICNNMYDFNKKIVERVQIIRSHEVAIMQLTDLLIGAISYTHRGYQTSPAKLKIIERIQKRSGYTLKKSTLSNEGKMNIFVWEAS